MYCTTFYFTDMLNNIPNREFILSIPEQSTTTPYGTPGGSTVDTLVSGELFGNNVYTQQRRKGM